MTQKPALDDGVPMSAVIVHHEVEIHFFWEFGVKTFQELEELLMTMAGTSIVRSLFPEQVRALQKEWSCRFCLCRPTDLDVVIFEHLNTYTKQRETQPHLGMRDLPVRKSCSTRKADRSLCYFGQQ